MKLHLIRVDSTDHGLFGHLETDNGFECVTLERHDINIPTGVYKIALFNSPHFKCLVPMLQGVPGREAIEIHCGNVEGDSRGCILVGSGRDENGIIASRKAFSGLMAAIGKADDISIEII